jgi:gamma-glutamylcyclotransferase (GGCT)/AIG2-like uncharacterized protein YtfP
VVLFFKYVKKRKRNKAMQIKYFSYGSNMGVSQMKSRCPSATCAGRAILLGHKLTFAGSSKTWGGKGVANVVSKKGEVVYGRVWTLTPRCLYALDKYEGYPVAYQRIKMPVIMEESGLSQIVWVYIKKGNIQINLPSSAYVRRMVEGLIDAGYQYDSEAFYALDDAVASVKFDVLDKH